MLQWVSDHSVHVPFPLAIWCPQYFRSGYKSDPQLFWAGYSVYRGRVRWISFGSHITSLGYTITAVIPSSTPDCPQTQRHIETWAKPEGIWWETEWVLSLSLSPSSSYLLRPQLFATSHSLEIYSIVITLYLRLDIWFWTGMSLEISLSFSHEKLLMLLNWIQPPGYILSGSRVPILVTKGALIT